MAGISTPRISEGKNPGRVRTVRQRQYAHDGTQLASQCGHAGNRLLRPSDGPSRALCLVHARRSAFPVAAVRRWSRPRWRRRSRSVQPGRDCQNVQLAPDTRQGIRFCGESATLGWAGSHSTLSPSSANESKWPRKPFRFGPFVTQYRGESNALSPLLCLWRAQPKVTRFSPGPPSLAFARAS